MADSVMRITDVHPSIDGDYPIGLTDFTNRDFHDIKRIANIRSQELSEAFEKGDTDLFVAFAVIALRHAGKTVPEDALWDSAVGKITLIAGAEDEVDDLPPTSAPPSETQNVPGGGSTPSEANGISGSGSRNGSDPREDDQSLTGHLHSDTGAMYPSGISAT